jgi:hypothetical protein
MTSLAQRPTTQHTVTPGRSSEPTPCRHGGRHKHGTRSCYVLDECGCPPCSRANSDYQDQRYRLIAAGQWAPLVDAAPVAAHVQALVDAGLQRCLVAERAGVAVSVVSKLLAGHVGSRRLRRMRAETARRLLAVPRPGIDATGTRRRLQALVAIGWPAPALNDQAGQEPGWVEQLLEQELVSETTAAQVAYLFERLWDCPPPQRTPHDKHAAEQARTHARKRGWGPPMAWDEELNPIDDPAAEPDLGEPVRRRSKLPPAEELRYLLDAGESVDMIASRFGVKPETVTRALQRDRAEAAGDTRPDQPTAAVDGQAA